jgi:hypothetical protein
MTPMLERAIEYARLGLSVHFQVGKRAFEKNWNSGAPKTVEQLIHEYQPHYNIGFQTGHRSKIGGKPVFVLDKDLRSNDPRHVNELDEEWRQLTGESLPTVITGSGGTHLYLQCEPDQLPTEQSTILKQSSEMVMTADGKKNAWMIEALLGGHACTLPPSTHPDTGRPYAWVNGGLDNIQSAPEAIIKAISAAEHPSIGPWEKIKPLHSELPPVLELEPDLLPEGIRAWAVDEARRLVCPLDFIVGPFLCALASIVGASCAIRPKANDNWTIVPVLWGLNVGYPGDKKSPAMAAAMKGVTHLVSIARNTFEGQKEEHATEKMIHKARLEALEARLKAAAKTATRKRAKPEDGESANVEDVAEELKRHKEEEPVEPKERRYMTNDPTIEVVGDILSYTPRGILVARDEFSGFLSSMEKENHQSDRPFWLEAWNGNQPFTIDRIGRGHIYIANLCASIFGCTQPDVLAERLKLAAGGENDGFLQRFQVTVFPDKRHWIWRDEAPALDAYQRMIEIFEDLSCIDPVSYGAIQASGYDKLPYFKFESDAQELFIQWSEDLHARMNNDDDDPLVIQHLAKFEKFCATLALIFHLIDCAAYGVRGHVPRDSMIRAAGFCAYFESHARRCYALLKGLEFEAAQALSRKIKQGALEDGFTARDVRRPQWTKPTEEDRVSSALGWLEDANVIRKMPPAPGRGRPTVRYEINPAIKPRRQAHA